jgi:polyphosphate kinase
MPRNFDRRVEAVVAVDDPEMHAKFRSLLETSLADNRQAWELQPDGAYVQRQANGGPERVSQAAFLRNSWGEMENAGSRTVEKDASRA